MKTKNFQKKLVFKKATVTQLNDNDLNRVNGGDWTDLSCVTICRTECVTGCLQCDTMKCM